MLFVTYIITIYNKEKYIANVISAVKQISGNFKKEYIIINDGSTDNSLNIAKNATKDMSNVTIVSQENKGPSTSLNIGIKLARGDVVQFVDGDDLTDIESTQTLLSAYESTGCKVVFGLRSTYDPDTLVVKQRSQSNLQIIDNPIHELLRGKIQNIRSIGATGSLVNTKLLRIVQGSDEQVFTQDFSLSLRCALYTKFAQVGKVVFYVPNQYNKDNLSSNYTFQKYQTLLAIYCFMKDNVYLADKYSKQIHQTLWSTLWKANKSAKMLPKYLLSKFSRKVPKSTELLDIYKQNLDDLSLKC